MNNMPSESKSVKVKDILILGFAFFATYFGAGNLIFPPQLGLVSGSSYGSALIGLTLSGILLPVFALLIISFHGEVRRITDHVGMYTYNILLALQDVMSAKLQFSIFYFLSLFTAICYH